MVRTPEQIVMVDTGVGRGPYMGVVYGRLAEALRAHEIDPGEVTIVFLTHAHSDQVRGV